MNAIRSWLQTIGLVQYADAFEANDIDIDLLAQVDDQVLKEMGVASAGHRLRIRDAIGKFAPASPAAALVSGVPAGPEVPAPSPERRQVTIMFCDLVEHILKGIIEPVRAWRVEHVAQVEGRFEARHHGPLTALIGRESELALLVDRWQQAKDGEGQVVLLSGEPGVGKSRITQALRERIASEPHARLRYQYSPFHTNSALHAVIQHLERAAAFSREDTRA